METISYCTQPMCKGDIGLPRRNKKEHIFNECSREESVRLNTNLHFSRCKLDHLEKYLKLKHDVRGSACGKEWTNSCPCWTSTETNPASFSSFQERERGFSTTNTNTNTETNFKLLTTRPTRKMQKVPLHPQFECCAPHTTASAPSVSSRADCPPPSLPLTSLPPRKESRHYKKISNLLLAHVNSTATTESAISGFTVDSNSSHSLSLSLSKSVNLFLIPRLHPPAI